MTARELIHLFVAVVAVGAGVILVHDGHLVGGLPLAGTGMFLLGRLQ